MAKQKKKQKPKLIDSGTVAGSVAASAVLAIWLFVEFSSPSKTEPNPDSSPPAKSTTSQEAESSSGKTQDSAPKAAPTWKDDPRWTENLNLGKEGIQQAKDAVKWNEEKGGDPFYFANQIHESGDKVAQAIRGMESLRKDLEDNSDAVSLIDKWLRHFKDNLPRRSK